MPIKHVALVTYVAIHILIDRPFCVDLLDDGSLECLLVEVTFGLYVHGLVGD